MSPQARPTSTAQDGLPEVLSNSRPQVVFGPGRLAEVGTLAKTAGATRVLLVSDQGIVRAGHVDRALAALAQAGLDAVLFDGAEENPSTEHVSAGVELARTSAIDFIIGLGGGSSMDCAKGINFLYTNGGAMSDYWGIDKAAKPMLPFIAIPTTAGTGSEAQSFALIRDPVTGRKMACGDAKAMAQVAILDPELTLTQPPAVAAAAGIDAIAHAVETAATTKRNEASRALSRAAWLRLEPSYKTAMTNPGDDEARTHMLVGAHLAGAAIERSMLGAAHACANPLTMRCRMIHGVAVGVMLPHVVRFNARAGANPYSDLSDNAETLARRLEHLHRAGRLPRTLRDSGVAEALLPDLAALAAKEWTGTFNPRPVGESDFLGIYQDAFV